MPTYLLIKCSDVKSVLVLNTVGFESRSFWDILCRVCVTGVRTTSTAVWVNWPLKKIWADHLICSMTAHIVTWWCTCLLHCEVGVVLCPEYDLTFVAIMIFWTLIHEEYISWRQISGKLQCSHVYSCTDFLVCRLSMHDYGWKWEINFC